jgi:hypothetical protein
MGTGGWRGPVASDRCDMSDADTGALGAATVGA